MSTMFGHVIQFASLDGKHWTDWFNHPFISEKLAKDSLKTLRLRYPNLIFRLIIRETTVIEHEVNE